MLSRRDKLLVQPWEDRRFKDHRSKCQRELDRKNKIQSDNYGLLQRLNAIMKVNRLDNHWTKPLPL
ncbi:Uncharacterized protein OBRU01_01994 [Operophtera brumata]|uniref:Uncharacterized protein n=1 Tax=Operophtera brumata TaxID=104452 RepID=A0A0L7K2M1_OPEBR|nr:Uncharacterized protein OBRU01_26854 [Operophtera brumata]KOB73617.1 Uncharacterized protein OBRU01_01994 [Operophtera brumata]